MKLPAVLRRVASILNTTFNYLRTRRQRRLYQQWIEQADLPPEAIPQEPQEEVAKEIAPRIDKKRLRVYLLFMLLGAALVIVCGGLIILVVRSC